MNLTLMYNASEDNRVVKTVSTILSLTGTLRDGSSILNPAILIEADVAALTSCNYAYISDFGRYYFITDIQSLHNGLVMVSMHVDVLMSYASGILGNTAIIDRQEADWNLYLNDGVIKTYQDPKVVIKEFPSGFSAPEIVLAVAGSTSS